MDIGHSNLIAFPEIARPWRNSDSAWGKNLDWVQDDCAGSGMPVSQRIGETDERMPCAWAKDSVEG
jgi:hypothetical protein